MCSSKRTVTLRLLNHSISPGTMPAAASELGLETMPTVLMMGIQEEFLIAFGAPYGAFHDAGFKSEFPHGPFHLFTSGLVKFRLADNPAFPHLAPAYFELRLDQYNHLSGWPEHSNHCRQYQRHGNKAHIANQQVHQFADIVELQVDRKSVV